jgi:hypothetical protein
MAAVEVLEFPEAFEDISPRYLHLVRASAPQPIRTGPSLQQRRASRARMLQRRRRTLAVGVLLLALSVLAIPGHVFGATTGTGLAGDLANSSQLASGMVYVVQPGDTVSTIAREMNSVNPALARTLLVRSLGSSVVVPGEHVLIP